MSGLQPTMRDEEQDHFDLGGGQIQFKTLYTPASSKKNTGGCVLCLTWHIFSQM